MAVAAAASSSGSSSKQQQQSGDHPQPSIPKSRCQFSCSNCVGLNFVRDLSHNKVQTTSEVVTCSIACMLAVAGGGAAGAPCRKASGAPCTHCAQVIIPETARVYPLASHCAVCPPAGLPPADLILHCARTQSRAPPKETLPRTDRHATSPCASGVESGCVIGLPILPFSVLYHYEDPGGKTHSVPKAVDCWTTRHFGSFSVLFDGQFSPRKKFSTVPKRENKCLIRALLWMDTALTMGLASVIIVSVACAQAGCTESAVQCQNPLFTPKMAFAGHGTHHQSAQCTACSLDNGACSAAVHSAMYRAGGIPCAASRPTSTVPVPTTEQS